MAIMSSARRTKIVSITSGKGGVGKTTLVCNMACALAKRGKKVLIFDGDLGMSNVDIMFNIKAQYNIHQVLTGEMDLQEAITHLDTNIDLISGGSGIVELNRLNSFQRRSVMESLNSLDGFYDYMIIDTAPGISDNVLYLNSAAQETAIVITPDPASITDSYALIKVLNQEYKEKHFSIVCNQVRDEIEGLALYNRFNDVVSRFLYVGLDYWGSIALDQNFRKSTQNQRLILRHEPNSLSAAQLLSVSAKLELSLARKNEKNGMQYFWDQVVGVA
jgi:flagellar biosynthesis protein FlhG